ncbi:type 2 isopentenyl-diphosphate Delta-isomerase [Agrilutibacter solisilvae]|uniref:Isopentenyl-diphosphate delta-isomerase n=1 Tax=Agrilutibacter solisilvae TaxID=2763317 RepID=A0A974XX66_9GAMM|nr:type 2 isopentenyl-diphosphate Delta-isomerase [Lysobacter solisilvae]QSX77486.1 type 2 isopentenyl-diphosphate Delta-isomerase [Lysobacter solisilvae]
MTVAIEPAGAKASAGATIERKDAHLDLCSTASVEPSQNDSLLSCVQLVHCAMPEMALEEVVLSTSFFGKTIRAPLLVCGMTGGSKRAERVNRALAEQAEQHGLAFGVGSQRAMIEDPQCASSYAVRDVAPKTVLIGNVGLATAASIGVDGVRNLMDEIDADAIALHLNAAQELTQPEGDRDFRNGYRIIESLARCLGGRLLVKETGCGIGPRVALRLFDSGVELIDVSGLGGTSWVRVEQFRASGVAADVAEHFASWGIPTAAAVASVRRAVGDRLTIVASGGLRTGLDVAKALAVGADLGGMALPLFRALEAGGPERVDQSIRVIVAQLRQALLLTGSRTPQELRQSPVVITGALSDWLAGLGSASVGDGLGNDCLLPKECRIAQRYRDRPELVRGGPIV